MSARNASPVRTGRDRNILPAITGSPSEDTWVSLGRALERALASLERARAEHGAAAMSSLIQLPRPRIERERGGEGWMVIRGSHGWLCGDRSQAIAELDELAAIERCPVWRRRDGR